MHRRLVLKSQGWLKTFKRENTFAKNIDEGVHKFEAKLIRNLANRYIRRVGYERRFTDVARV